MLVVVVVVVHMAKNSKIKSHANRICYSKTLRKGPIASREQPWTVDIDDNCGISCSPISCAFCYGYLGHQADRGSHKTSIRN